MIESHGCVDEVETVAKTQAPEAKNVVDPSSVSLDSTTGAYDPLQVWTRVGDRLSAHECAGISRAEWNYGSDADWLQFLGKNPWQAISE